MFKIFLYRSFVTTTTSVDTILVPVTFRGSEILQTISDTRTKVILLPVTFRGS